MKRTPGLDLPVEYCEKDTPHRKHRFKKRFLNAKVLIQCPGLPSQELQGL